MEDILKDEKKFIEYLYTLEDLKYKEFHSGITLINNLIGIRMPILKDIAKKISKIDFFKMFDWELFYYEERLILGLALGYSNLDFDILLKYLDKYVCYIDNWGICDSVSSNLKQFKKKQEIGYDYILKLISSNEDFSIRLGFVLLINHYINDKYVEKIIDLVYNYKSNEKYYIDMAISWLVSFLYIKYPAKTIKLFNDKVLNKFTNNKAISKICDSYRVNVDEKNILKGFRVK